MEVRKQHSRPTLTIAVLLLLPCAYVLGILPAAVLWDSYLDYDSTLSIALDRFYTPLLWAYDNVKAVEVALDWYFAAARLILDP